MSSFELVLAEEGKRKILDSLEATDYERDDDGEGRGGLKEALKVQRKRSDEISSFFSPARRLLIAPRRRKMTRWKTRPRAEFRVATMGIDPWIGPRRPGANSDRGGNFPLRECVWLIESLNDGGKFAPRF